MVKNVFKKLGKKQKNNKGFSLVELIVVIAIMAVLVGVLAPQLIKYVEKSREATDIQTCDNIATALKTYYADEEVAASATAAKVTVTLGKTELGTAADTAVKDAGLTKAKIKGTKWTNDKITIVYDKKDGTIEKVDPNKVKVGDTIIVKPGEKVPLDGVIIEGQGTLDTSSLTGESLPREVGLQEDVISGSISVSGVLTIKVTKAFGESTVSKILELVENASSKKARVENFITRFAKYYTPVVTIGAVALAIIPPLFCGGQWGDWIQRACIFLVISCPCALVISVPLGFFGGIGAASRIGILVKGSNYLEALAEMSTIVFDKTGTLTKGEFKVSGINAVGCSEKELLEVAAYSESYSTHPIAESIKNAYGEKIDTSKLQNVEEIAGHGIHAQFAGKDVFVGNEKLMNKQNISYEKCDAIGTIIYVAIDGKFAGSLVISDEIKEGAKEAIADMKHVGVRKTVMLSGDQKEIVEKVAGELGIDEYHAQLLPADKVDRVEKLLEQKNEKDKVAFVGDGINDAPVLTRADIGIAMGSMGSDAAIEAADVVLMDDDVTKIASVVKISGKTLSIVKQNIVFALGVKALVLILGAFGVANMWEAVFADVGVSVIAILNSMRTLKEE